MEWLTPDVIEELLKYPILVLVLVMFYLNHKQIGRLMETIDKLSDKIGK